MATISGQQEQQITIVLVDEESAKQEEDREEEYVKIRLWRHLKRRYPLMTRAKIKPIFVDQQIN